MISLLKFEGVEGEGENVAPPLIARSQIATLLVDL